LLAKKILPILSLELFLEIGKLPIQIYTLAQAYSAIMKASSLMVLEMMGPLLLVKRELAALNLRVIKVLLSPVHIMLDRACLLILPQDRLMLINLL
jgi:hypothetical protein